MMNKEEITIGFKDQTGFRISECDITTGKIVVNGIEITSVEDWEKVTNSLIDLQQRIDKAIEYNKQIIKDTQNFYRPTSDTIYSGDCLMDIAEQNIEILGGKE